MPVVLCHCGQLCWPSGPRIGGGSPCGGGVCFAEIGVGRPRGGGSCNVHEELGLRNLEDPPWSQLGALPEGWEGTPWGEGLMLNRSHPGEGVGTPMVEGLTFRAWGTMVIYFNNFINID